MAEGKKGFSWRHETNEQHLDRQAERMARLEVQKENAQDRVAIAELRKPSQQLQRLDRKFGEGVGAVKERAKLVARIAAGDKSRAQVAEEKAKAEEKKGKKGGKKEQGE